LSVPAKRRIILSLTISYHCGIMNYPAMIATLGLGQIVSWGILFYTFPLLSGPIGQDLAADKDAVYVAATLALLMSGLAAYPVGLAVDRGHGRLVLVLGSLLGGALLVALAFVSSLAALYIVYA